MLSSLNYLLIVLAGGSVNALAGGGTLITFPLLTLLGISPPPYRLPYISTDPHNSTTNFSCNRFRLSYPRPGYDFEVSWA